MNVCPCVPVAEMLEDVPLTGEAGKELNDVIRESYLDVEFDSKWQPARIQIIHSKSLQSLYDGLCACGLFILANCSTGSILVNCRVTR